VAGEREFYLFLPLVPLARLAVRVLSLLLRDRTASRYFRLLHDGFLKGIITRRFRLPSCVCVCVCVHSGPNENSIRFEWPSTVPAAVDTRSLLPAFQILIRSERKQRFRRRARAWSIRKIVRAGNLNVSRFIAPNLEHITLFRFKRERRGF